MKKQKSFKKALHIVINSLLYVFLGICILAMILSAFSKKSATGSAEIFGYQIMRVTTASMAECAETDVSDYEVKSISQNSIIFVKAKPTDEAELDQWYSELKVGDVLTFRYQYTQQVTITHRIVSITEKPTGGYIIQLMGDNRTDGANLGVQTVDTSDNPATSPNYIIGKVTGQSYPLGLIVYFIGQPIGLVTLVILPCFIIILLEIIRIVSVLGAEKKKKQAEEQAQKDSELEALRKRLAELENAKLGDSDESADKQTSPQADEKQ